MLRVATTKPEVRQRWLYSETCVCEKRKKERLCTNYYFI